MIRRSKITFARSICLAALAVGCGGDESRSVTESQPPIATESPLATVAERLDSPTQPESGTEPRTTGAEPTESTPPRSTISNPPRNHRLLAELLDEENDERRSDQIAQAPVFNPIPNGKRELPIPDAKAAVAGIRRLTSKHLTLYTDLPPNDKVDALPGVFDLAVPQWCRYFEIDQQRARNWHMFGCVMKEKGRFQGVGLLPASIPDFPNGFQRGEYLWLHEQPTAYYRRHLLLHEGTHAFMNDMLGGNGPPWYSEGMAELLGTHRWDKGKLTLRYMPRDKTETPDWGRVRIVQDAMAAGRGMMPVNIMGYSGTAHLQNEPYGWCWAMAAFLDFHPRYQTAFRGMAKDVTRPDFNKIFESRIKDWPTLNEQWQLFVMNIDYGYDVARSSIIRKPATALTSGRAVATIAADHGWQSTGVRLEAGKPYAIKAENRYQVGQSTGIWWCEPNGITLEYHNGRPLGLLLGAIRDDQRPLSGLSPLTKPKVVGAETRWSPKTSGTLYLKINEASGSLYDNRGELSVTIEILQ